MRTAREIAAHYRFRGNPTNGNYRIPFPAHKDDDPNLAVKDGDNGGLLVYCHCRECSAKEIFGAFRANGLETDREWEYPNGKVVAFRTKPQLARGMVERAVESGVPFGWVAGDTVYGSDRKLRRWLEQQEIPHVLAVKSNEKLWAWTEEGPRQVRADRLASQVEESGWIRLSAGDGAKGPRVYDWTWVSIRPLREPGKGYWLLARRSIAQPEELAWYVCFGPAETTLEELVRVAGIRWTIEECFEEAKGQVGLDQYEVRKWEGWYRHITLAMLAHAYWR